MYLMTGIKTNWNIFLKISILPIFFFFLFNPLFSNAAEVQTNLELNIQQDTVFTENTYFLANKNNVNGAFEQDLFIGGFENYFNGQVNNDLFVVGLNSNIQGNVNGDLRIISGNVDIRGKIQGDLVVFGGEVILQEGSDISGDVILVGGKIIQNTTVEKLKIISAYAEINSTINSDLEATTQKLILSKNANIQGNLTYYSPASFEKDSQATINGFTNYNQINNISDTGFVKTTLINLVTFWHLLKFITTLILALILVFFFRVFTQNIIDISIDKPIKSFGIGLLGSILIPVVLSILMLSLFAFPIGLIGLLIYIILFSISVALSGIIVGSIIYSFINKKQDSVVSFKTASIGVVIITFISFVPYMGPATKIIFDLVAIGSVLVYLKRIILKR